MHDWLLLSLGVSCACLVLVFIARRSRRRRHLPPGPNGLPTVGNLFNFPTDYSWFQFAAWAQEYESDILHFEVLGQHIVVLNTLEAAKELFEARGQIYSDRQQTVMIHELTGWDRNMAMMPPGDRWRAQRRLFHQAFRPQAIPAYREPLTKAARTLLLLLLETPEDFLRHMRLASGSAMLDVMYGMDVDPRGDERMDVVERAVATVPELFNQGLYLVDIIPILKYLPAWLPGMGFKRQAAAWKKDVDKLFEVPYAFVKTVLATGKSKPCVVSELISSLPAQSDSSDAEEIIMEFAGTAYGGADTVVYALTLFVLAMILHPEAQARVQEELDRVVGRDRLPELADREDLPYLEALIKELLRWHPIGPTGVPHKSTADDWYNGFLIPAGALVIPNVWSMLHDPARYPSPASFRPERFLTPSGTPDPTVPDPDAAFGFGRRVCPGRHLARAALFIYAAHMLHTFTMAKPVRADGSAEEPSGECSARFFWVPKPFRASFTPRFEGAEELIRLAGGGAR
ncbi:cytochrome P450 [Phanerochaete sordida]|uniref:Cytochrome P450 n=1 Tax=Phanerochaete sordida TaxID=48140 RepID=A0A9P3GJ26_9APHY|nr:cytochrome P450 [Phanerochaete sordida]